MKSIGFGIERIAWAALDRPWLAGIVSLVLLAFIGYGVTQVRFDQDLGKVFAGPSKAYQDYTKALGDSVDPESESLVLVEGPNLGRPDVFARLADLNFELQLIDGVDNVFSPFALREAPDADGDTPLVVADPAAGLTPELAARIRAHPILGAKLLSDDLTGLIFVVTPSADRPGFPFHRKLTAAIQSAAAETLKDTGLTVTISGFPAIGLGILDVLVRDQIRMNGLGALIGMIMSLIVFRSLVASILTAGPAIVGALFVVGGMGLFGVPVTVFSVVIPALVMILGYADAMHLSYAFRRHRDAGMSVADAERAAQKELGAACVLTALTTSVAFLSLVFSDIEIVSNFGWIGAIGVLVGGLVVIVGHALTALAIGRFWRSRQGSATGETRNLLTWLQRPSAAIARFSVNQRRWLQPAAIAALLVLGALHFSVPPEYSTRENLPADHPANAALGRIDRNFGGAFPVQIVVPLRGLSPTSPEGLDRIATVHRAVAAVDGVDTPLSLWSIAEWLGADAGGERLAGIVADSSPATRARFLGVSDTAFVSVNIHEAPTYVTVPLLDRIEAAARAAGGDDVSVTGMTVMSARESSRTITNLNWNLLSTIVAGLVLIGLAFRSVPMGLISLVPNVLPIVATGAALYLTGRGMQITNVIALNVAFGIAVDDTIHYLNRLRNAEDGRSPLADRLVASARDVGPVLIGTTVIIIFGLSTTLTSGLPTVTLFGALVSITLAVALLGDLIALPALIAGIGKPWFGKEQRRDVVSADLPGSERP